MNQFSYDELYDYCIKYPCDAEEIVKIIMNKNFYYNDEFIYKIFKTCHRSFRTLLTSELVRKNVGIIKSLYKDRLLETSEAQKYFNDYYYKSLDDEYIETNFKPILSIYNRY